MNLRGLFIVGLVGFATACDNFVETKCPGNISVYSLESSAGNTATAVGCHSASYNASGAGGIGCGLLFSSGSPQLDNDINRELQRISQVLPLPVYFPEVRLYLEGQTENNSQIENAVSSPNGYILMGYNLLTSTLAQFQSTVPYAGIMAHEWGHQIQFQRGHIDPRADTSRDIELVADAWAGYYLALVEVERESLQQFYDLIFSLGDIHFNSSTHHGTPAQRKTMAEVGYESGLRDIEFGRQSGYDALNAEWNRYIRDNFAEQTNVGSTNAT